MKLTMRLTLDDLVRSLRKSADAIAEDIEAGGRDRRDISVNENVRKSGARADHDVTGA